MHIRIFFPDQAVIMVDDEVVRFVYIARSRTGKYKSMARPHSFRWLFTLFATLSLCVNAQPSPDVQARISAAINAATNATNLDYTAFVNPFIGTGMQNCSRENIALL